MISALATGLSPTDYLARERRSDRKHEYIDGELRAMPGASRDHNLIAGNLAHLLRVSTREQPFEVYQSDMRLRIPNGPYYYPDVVLAPSPPTLEDAVHDTLLNPLVIVECLSPTTETIDRGEKLDNYRRIPSLTDYLLVAQDQPRIEHWERSGDRWRLVLYTELTQTARVTTPACELPLAGVYHRLFGSPGVS